MRSEIEIRAELDRLMESLWSTVGDEDVTGKLIRIDQLNWILDGADDTDTEQTDPPSEPVAATDAIEDPDQTPLSEAELPDERGGVWQSVKGAFGTLLGVEAVKLAMAEPTDIDVPEATLTELLTLPLPDPSGKPASKRFG